MDTPTLLNVALKPPRTRPLYLMQVTTSVTHTRAVERATYARKTIEHFKNDPERARELTDCDRLDAILRHLLHIEYRGSKKYSATLARRTTICLDEIRSLVLDIGNESDHEVVNSDRETRPAPQEDRFDFEWNDGGRSRTALSGRRNGYRQALASEDRAGDCVTRAIAIGLSATGDDRPIEVIYSEVWNELAARSEYGRYGADNGVADYIYGSYLQELGWSCVATPNGRMVPSRLPSARVMLVRSSRHINAIVDGKVLDTGRPQFRLGRHGGSRKQVRFVWLPPSEPDAITQAQAERVAEYASNQLELERLKARFGEVHDEWVVKQRRMTSLRAEQDRAESDAEYDALEIQIKQAYREYYEVDERSQELTRKIGRLQRKIDKYDRGEG